jgi:iron complex transport system ATP-binding protein
LLARLLAGEPQWLLADEPLANLDPAQQLEMMELLQDQAKIGHGVAVILHDLGHAAHFADDIILMHGGRILAAGAKEDVLTPDNLARAFGIKVILGRTGRGRMNIRILGRID